MKKAVTYIGINIQYPISRLILEGKKTIETRTYPIPKEYVGKELIIIETPGESGNFKARIIGLIKFGESFPYKNAQSFYKDQAKHCVSPTSTWKWVHGKTKWGWPIFFAKPISERPAPIKKGIKYTCGISI